MRKDWHRRLLALFVCSVWVMLVAVLGGAQEPAQSPEAVKEFIIVPASTQIPLVLQNSVNTKTARPGDFVYFETVYPVVVNNRILIPVGSFVRGQVTKVKRPGRIKGRGELHVRFDELTLPNGYTTTFHASLAGAGTANNEEVNREEGGITADSTKSEDIATVATTTVAGVGVGAAASRRGGKGAAIGAGAGAAAGLAWIFLTRGRELVLPRGLTVEIVLNRDLPLDAEMAKFDWTGQATPIPGPARRQPQRRRRIGPRIPF
ncbi:MAG: hypothetical protein ACE5H2_02115 [Terriglobia bacterium]